MEITESTQGGARIIALQGRLDATSSAATESQILSTVDLGARQIIMDLSQLDYISSAGLRVFLVVSKRLTAEGGKIVLCKLQSQVQEIFDIAGFTGLFPIVADRAAALAALT